MRLLSKTLQIAIVMCIGMFMCVAQLSADEFKVDLDNRYSVYILNVSNAYNSYWLADFGWMPELFAEYPFKQDWRASAEVSLDNNLRYMYVAENHELDWEVKPYRAWAALSYQDTELKAGLQHIRFGPAQIFRPLQWFDNLNPLALLQDSEGVTGLTLSHFFPNPELRFWVLPIVEGTKGQEWLATKKGTWEFGGRGVIASPLGETGLSYHQRVVEHSADASKQVNEYRFGFDQRVDGFMGAWVETDINIFSDDIYLDAEEDSGTEARFLGSATIGGDYTLGIGNGVYVLAEGNYNWHQTREAIDGKGDYQYDDFWQAGLLLNYPIGLVDALYFIGTYLEWDERFSGELSWRRTFDKMSYDFTLGFTKNNSPQDFPVTGIARFTISYDI